MRDKLLELFVYSGRNDIYPDITKDLAVLPEDKKEVDVIEKKVLNSMSRGKE